MSNWVCGIGYNMQCRYDTLLLLKNLQVVNILKLIEEPIENTSVTFVKRVLAACAAQLSHNIRMCHLSFLIRSVLVLVSQFSQISLVIQELLLLAYFTGTCFTFFRHLGFWLFPTTNGVNVCEPCMFAASKTVRRPFGILAPETRVC